MKITQGPGTLGLLTLCLIAGPFAAAQDSGWYLGANAGQTKARLDPTAIAQRQLDGGFATALTAEDAKDTGFKVFAGYQFSRFFALEGGYFNLGKSSFSADTLPLGTLDGRLKVDGLHVDLVPSLPLTEKFSAFVRLGATYAQAKDTFTGTGFAAPYTSQPSTHAWSYKFGGGLQYDFTRAFGMRAEWERYRIQEPVGNKGDVDLLSAGVLFRFGRSRPAPAPVQAAYVAAPAPPPPPPEVVVVRPATQIYCSTLDLQFTVDNDEIRDQDKERLAVVGTFLRTYPDTKAIIEGHTDNVGTKEHNQKLSEARAFSVVTYLTTVGHIAPARLSAVGYGDTRPVADNATEEGKRRNRRIDAVIPCATDIEGLQVATARLSMALFIDFDQDRAEVKAEFAPELRKVANFLKANPTVKATVEGHTGNLKLSQEKAVVMSQTRAQNVVDYLVDTCGIDRSRLNARGFGTTRRYAYNTDPNGLAENRRVNIIFDYPAK